MLKIINIYKYLNLGDVGFLELIFALTPMLSGFGLAGLPLSLLMWFFLLVIIAFQGKFNKAKIFKPLLYLVIYWLAHTLMIMVVDNVNLYGIISQILYFGVVFALFPTLNAKKLRGSLNWVALIAILGLLYQWADIVRGEMIHPLEIPGLTMPEWRYEALSIRPSSFFMEPAAYVAFMICPLTFSLIDKKRFWSIAIILSVFLTTSTTGLVLSFLMLGVSIFGKREKIASILAVFIIGGALFFSLTHFNAFEAGVEKFEDVDTETNVRLRQGLLIVSTMSPEEYLIGAPFDSPFNYCMARGVKNVVYYGDTVYMSTFWLLILCYGVVGLFLYLNIYYRIFRLSRDTWPLVVSLCTVMFSSGYGIQGMFVFTLIILLVIAKDDQKNKIQISRYIA